MVGNREVASGGDDSTAGGVVGAGTAIGAEPLVAGTAFPEQPNWQINPVARTYMAVEVIPFATDIL